MPVAANPFKRALAAGRTQIGLWQALGSAVTAEVCAAAGFDWLLFDGEHGPNDVPRLAEQLRAVAPFPAHPVGRPPLGEVRLIKQYLDIGFQTLVIPLVETSAQAEQLVRACRYPPQGIRGVGGGLVRASGYGRMSDYLDSADDEICLVVQVETRAGLDNLDAIAATTGVDGVFVGPADLAAALGHRGRPGAAPVQAAIEDAFVRIRRAGKPAGTLCADAALVARYQTLGCSFIAVGTDVSLLAHGGDALAARYGRGNTGGSGGSGNAY
ncbi:MAG: HpcH/HpaI aldolase/citrate lyase family protein [Gammaproteobacteria bacterium]